ncbi:hypothetical protein HJG60_010467 [Phyllostomus discolor]|uniref:Uncharacterized protein n=1 Tax=Phyllostomus discolor TaxID=89673 RepID=A0A834AN25_9CHIR|nr:hypothetical protein HJG60_010467 [Phyllostomus discolor]
MTNHNARSGQSLALGPYAVTERFMSGSGGQYKERSKMLYLKSYRNVNDVTLQIDFSCCERPKTSHCSSTELPPPSALKTRIEKKKLLFAGDRANPNSSFGSTTATCAQGQSKVTKHVQGREERRGQSKE